MVRPIVFFVFVFVLLAIIGFNSKEEFTNFLGVEWTTKNKGTPGNCNTRAVKVTELGIGNIEASPAPASNLPSAPVGFHAKETPAPYRDPVKEPAKYIRILAVKEDLQAFFGFQAQSLEKLSDSSTQLPLMRARADLSDLINVQSVMERNPGLQSRINNKQLDDILSNLKYLRDMINDLKVDKVVEGFVANTITDKKRANLKDLESFKSKVIVELNRLGASGTTDLLTQGRINTLIVIKQELDEVIRKIEMGVYKLDTIPIFKSDIEKSLPILGNTNKALPKLIKKESSSPAIAILFPKGLDIKNSEQATQLNNIAKGYIKNIYEEIINLPKGGRSPKGSRSPKRSRSPKSSRSPKNKKISRHPKHRKPNPNDVIKGIPGMKNYPSASVPGTLSKKSQYGKILNHKTDYGQTPGLPGTSNRIYPDPVSGSLDWEKRSIEIVKQIKKRGLNPEQFGAISIDTEVDEDFSWRGYTKMMCTRLNATTDPGLASTVGCPPDNWQGWRL